jgi:hypothetical protein
MLEILKRRTEREVMKVTFDSNVWEKLVSESPDYPTIKRKDLKPGDLSIPGVDPTGGILICMMTPNRRETGKAFAR